jgi:hypothetical protein
MSAMVSVDLLDVLDEDGGDLPVGVKDGLMELSVGDGVLERVVVVPALGDLGAEGQSEESVAFEHGVDCRFEKIVSASEVLECMVGELIG